jgi:ketosteroid isomerase-like protein
VNKHTPGPWRNEGGISATWEDGEEVQVCALFTTKWTYTEPDAHAKNDRMRRESEANARLIAAAPELLEALEAVMSGQIGGTPDLDAERFQKARAAIAKARGEA